MTLVTLFPGFHCLFILFDHSVTLPPPPCLCTGSNQIPEVVKSWEQETMTWERKVSNQHQKSKHKCTHSGRIQIRDVWLFLLWATPPRFQILILPGPDSHILKALLWHINWDQVWVAGRMSRNIHLLLERITTCPDFVHVYVSIINMLHTQPFKQNQIFVQYWPHTHFQ